MRAIDLLEVAGGRRTPFLAQSEASECGLACLAMVAGRHGLRTDLPALRRRFSLSLKGSTLKALMQIAEQIGFTARPLRGEAESLHKLPLPAVLHWDLNHFVVLTRTTRGVGGRRYHIHDPARGPRVLREGEISRHFTGVALELAPSETFRPSVERSKLRMNQLWSKLSGLWSGLRNVLMLSVILQLLALATPFYLQIAIDTVFPAFDADLLLMLAAGFGGLAVINMLTAWLRNLILVNLSNSLSYQMVSNLNRHLLRLPLAWFEKRHVGDIISRVGSTQPISQLLSRGLVTAFIDGLMAFLTLALMFAYSPALAALALVAWALFAGLKIAFLHTLRMRNVDAIRTAAKESSAFIESVRGIEAIKSFGQEANRHRGWQQLKADAVNAQIKLGRVSAGFEAAGQLILAIERIVFVYLAVRLAMGGEFTIGMIFAFQAYKQQFLDAGTRLIDQAIQFKILDVHLGRISDIALSRPEDADAPASAGSVRARGLIELRDLGFRYGAGEPEVFRDVNLQIEPGEMVALVGPSGGGKTTLLKTMIGLFSPTSGQVLVDGRSLSSLPSSEWRRQIGVVSQDGSLFAGTLAENIAFFDPDIDMARVIEVANLARIHHDIEAMPMRYETLVGDMGSVLSGGQKQRILLARALYGDPAILFMDEGTAHLDAASEAAVMDVVKALPITRIISAHRPLAIQAATRTVLINGGYATQVTHQQQPSTSNRTLHENAAPS